MASDSALIVVSPSDSVDTIVRKIRDVGASSVELLVPDGTPALQARSGFAQLRRSLERDGIVLLIISSDEKTLDAARLNKVDTVGVQGARVTFPTTPGDGGLASPYATRTLPAEERDRPAAPIADQDAEFLNALDQVAAQNRYAGLTDDDAEMFAELDDLSETIQRSPWAGHRGRSDDELAAALDTWSQATDESRAARGDTSDEDWETAFGDEGAGRRVRAEDIDLSDDDLRRQRGGRRTEALRARAQAEAIPPIPGWRRGARDTRQLDLEAAEQPASQRRSLVALLLPLVILLLLIAIAALWYFSSRATVTVTPPVASVSELPFSGVAIPLAANPTDANAAAVQAESVSADAEFTTQGQVISETLAPVGTAKGVIRIINELPQTVELPVGTEFIATNAQSQEVRFSLDVPAVVPAAITTSSVGSRVTTFGAIDVAVTARSPGSASNVGQDAIKQMLIPGQQPIVSDSSNFLISHQPIGGGDEQPQRIVTNEDVQRVLGEALTGLYDAGVRALREQIDDSSQGIDLRSVYPDPETLGNDFESYEPPVVEPPVGQPVDPANPTFNITVRTRFTGLAAPLNLRIEQQLERVAPEHLSACETGFSSAYTVSNWHWDWDTSKFTIDGVITCTPSEELSSETLRRVRDAVRGRSREEAEAALQALQQQELIGSYTLPPDKDRFPSFDPLLQVEATQPAQPMPETQ